MLTSHSQAGTQTEGRVDGGGEAGPWLHGARGKCSPVNESGSQPALLPEIPKHKITFTFQYRTKGSANRLPTMTKVNTECQPKLTLWGQRSD